MEQDNKITLDLLPIEILNKIFDFTKNENQTFLHLAKTCKTFYNYFKKYHRITIINNILWKRYIKMILSKIKIKIINYSCEVKEYTLEHYIIEYQNHCDQSKYNFTKKNINDHIENINKFFDTYVEKFMIEYLCNHPLNHNLISQILLYNHIKFDFILYEGIGCDIKEYIIEPHNKDCDINGLEILNKRSILTSIYHIFYNNDFFKISLLQLSFEEKFYYNIIKNILDLSLDFHYLNIRHCYNDFYMDFINDLTLQNLLYDTYLELLETICDNHKKYKLKLKYKQ